MTHFEYYSSYMHLFNRYSFCIQAYCPRKSYTLQIVHSLYFDRTMLTHIYTCTHCCNRRCNVSNLNRITFTKGGTAYLFFSYFARQVCNCVSETSPLRRILDNLPPNILRSDTVTSTNNTQFVFFYFSRLYT